MRTAICGGSITVRLLDGSRHRAELTAEQVEAMMHAIGSVPTRRMLHPEDARTDGRGDAPAGRRPATERRDRQAHWMRAEGFTWEEIGVALGITAGMAKSAVRRVEGGRYGDVAGGED